MPAVIPVTNATTAAYAAENERRRQAGLPEIRVAVGRAPVRAAMPKSPAVVKAPSVQSAPSRLVWIRAGLTNAGRIEHFGHAASCEGWLPEAVRRAADRIATGETAAGGAPFRITLNHGKTLDTMATGRISVRHFGGDLVVRWRPGPEHAALVELIARKGRIGASIDIAGSARSTSSGGVRLISEADIHGVALLTEGRGAYITAGAVVGGVEGSLDDTGTVMRFFAACGDFDAEAGR